MPLSAADGRDKRIPLLDSRDKRIKGDKRDKRLAIDNRDSRWGPRKGIVVIPAFFMIYVYTAFTLGLYLQPRRWDHTPAYGILLDIFSQGTWAVFYLLGALGLGASIIFRRRRWFVVTAHTYAILLGLFWEIAFITRTITDEFTTIVNPISWSAYLAILLFSAFILDADGS